MTELHPIVQLLEIRTGLDVSTLGKVAFEHALQRRAEIVGKNQAEYAAWVERDVEEWNELIEELIVPETWFFRDSEPFRCLTAFGLSSLKKMSSRVSPMRILSAPCASGEEPYSIAMVLLQAGFSVDQFQIEGLDISRRMLDRARAGKYGQNAFRREGIDYQARYFTPESDHWCLKSPPLGCVEFQYCNLFETETFQRREPYDAIFCRNLLIYLKRDAREKLLRSLAALLRPEGLLFVGHSEILYGLSDDFESVPHPRSYAYRRHKQTASASSSKRVNSFSHEVLKASISSVMRSVSTNSVDSKSVLYSGSKSENPSESLDSQMTSIQQWADEGRIVQAQQKLSELLSRNSGSAENWCLLGMLHENLLAVREAEACYQKALYLDATCYDALVHLAFLAEQRRDTDQAARLRSRAKRVVSVSKGDPV